MFNQFEKQNVHLKQYKTHINGDKFYKKKTPPGIQDTRLNGFRRTLTVVECIEFTDSEELHLFLLLQAKGICKYSLYKTKPIKFNPLTNIWCSASKHLY